jgi:hypothetical protein
MKKLFNKLHLVLYQVFHDNIPRIVLSINHLGGSGNGLAASLDAPDFITATYAIVNNRPRPLGKLIMMD